ncbi:MAG TPA: ATP-binding protein [Noviherbaspirillum sp.]|nr:ATP-binding protein [Noviherbaspirillum sp.]
MTVAGANLLTGGGEVRSLMRSLDWSASPLGAPRDWPAALRMTTHLMLDSGFPMFLAWGTDLCFLYNDAYIDILGRKHPAALGRPFQEIWAEIWPDISPLIARALAGETTYAENMPLAMLRKGHMEQTWFTFSYSPLRDEAGQIRGMLCACTETTQQVLADRRQVFQLALGDRLRGLDEPEEIMAAAVEALGQELVAARVGYAEIDVPTDSIHVDRDWTAPPRLAIGGRVFTLTRFGPALVELLRSGTTLVIDDVQTDPRCEPYRPDYAGIGAAAALCVPLIRNGVLSAILYVHEAQPRHWSGHDIRLVQDVADRIWSMVERARAEERRRRAEAALHAQLEAERNRLRSLFEQAPSFMAVLRGPNHVFELANAAYLRLIGTRDLIGKPARQVLPDVEGQPFFDLLDRVYRTGEPYFENEARLMLQPVQGEPQIERFIDFVYQPLTDASGNVSGIFVDGYDVTERVHAFAALREADQRKDEFLAMLAHELRNPLAPISAAAQLLRISGNDPDRVRKTSEVIARQADHMTGLVNDLLDVSRVTRGMVKLDFQVQDLRDVVRAALEQTRALLEAKGHAVALDFGADCLHAPQVCGDRVRLVQIVSNLLNNAAKYTPDGGRITLRLQVSAGEASLTVSDTGIGIHAELLPHIFEPFTQAERTPDRSQGGLGLGLALVRRLAELHGGSVSASSPGPNAGSSFTLRLPRVRGTRVVKDAAGPAGAPARRVVPLRIMVVDDNEDAAHSLAMLLGAEGHQVSTAARADAALALAREQAPQVCLLDIGLPGMDGYELARRLRALSQTRDAMLIALTGYGQPQDRARSFEAGFDHHLVKPAEIRRLLDLVSRRAA